MSRTAQKMDVDVMPPTQGIECTPEGLVKAVAGCFGFMLSVVMVVALCLTAVGMFWTAQNFDRVTTHISWPSTMHTPPSGEFLFLGMPSNQNNLCSLVGALSLDSTSGLNVNCGE